MNLSKYVLVLLSCLVGALPLILSAAPPRNDNFADRIILMGNSITFTGALAEATLEERLPEVRGNPILPGIDRHQSVWWEWTASQSSAVNLEILGPPNRPLLPEGTASVDGLMAYSNNGCGVSSTNGGMVFAVEPMGGMALDPAKPHLAFTFPTVQGATYFLQLLGSSSATYVIHLAAAESVTHDRVERSTNVLDWSPELSFPLGFAVRTNVARGIFKSDQSSVLSAPAETR